MFNKKKRCSQKGFDSFKPHFKSVFEEAVRTFWRTAARKIYAVRAEQFEQRQSELRQSGGRIDNPAGYSTGNYVEKHLAT